MKTDSIWYRLFKTFPGIFFELLGQSPTAAENYEFASVEVKQTAFRLDGVFLPRANGSQPIYFSEFQFQSDSKLYSRFFTEIFMYLDKTELPNDWRGAVVWASRSLDSGDTMRYQELLESQRVQRIYLDELDSQADSSIGLSLIKLVVESPSTAPNQAKRLIQRTKTQIAEAATQREILELVETIIVYKFPTLNREMIERMLDLAELKQTRVYQEAKLEGKLESILPLLELGLSVEQIAQALRLDVEIVRQAAQRSPEL